MMMRMMIRSSCSSLPRVWGMVSLGLNSSRENTRLKYVQWLVALDVPSVTDNGEPECLSNRILVQYFCRPSLAAHPGMVRLC